MAGRARILRAHPQAPYLNAFRGLIPPIGGSIDLSPILAFVVLNAFQSTAAALPAELPSRGAAHPRARAHAARRNNNKAATRNHAKAFADGIADGISTAPRKRLERAIARAVNA